MGFGYLTAICGVSAYEAVNTCRSSMKKLWKRAVEVPKSGPLPTTALQSIALWGLGFQGHGGFMTLGRLRTLTARRQSRSAQRRHGPKMHRMGSETSLDSLI